MKIQAPTPPPSGQQLTQDYARTLPPYSGPPLESPNPTSFTSTSLHFSSPTLPQLRPRHQVKKSFVEISVSNFYSTVPTDSSPAPSSLLHEMGEAKPLPQELSSSSSSSPQEPLFSPSKPRPASTPTAPPTPKAPNPPLPKGRSTSRGPRNHSNNNSSPLEQVFGRWLGFLFLVILTF